MFKRIWKIEDRNEMGSLVQMLPKSFFFYWVWLENVWKKDFCTKLWPLWKKCNKKKAIKQDNRFEAPGQVNSAWHSAFPLFLYLSLRLQESLRKMRLVNSLSSSPFCFFFHRKLFKSIRLRYKSWLNGCYHIPVLQACITLLILILHLSNLQNNVCSLYVTLIKQWTEIILEFNVFLRIVHRV